MDPDQPSALSKKARDYGKAILIHSLRSSTSSLYPGQNFANLARLLDESHERTPNSPTQEQSRADDHILAVLYDLGVQAADTKSMHYRGHQFTQLPDARKPIKDSLGQTLFLRGHLSSDWIKTVGAEYHVDPEFFQRHLSFQSAPIHQTVFALPSLPSSTHNIISLSVSTICCRDPTFVGGTFLQDRTEKETDGMARYLRQFASVARQGDSIVRAYTSLDERFSVLEQTISISIERNGKGWIAIVWLDSGKDLTQSPPGPWLLQADSGDLGVTMFPVQQHLKRVAIKHNLATTNGTQSSAKLPDSSTFSNRLFHSSSLLPFEYAQFLDHDLASRDVTVALADIFRFAALSEVQCLNLMSMKIDDAIRSRDKLIETSNPIDILLLYKSLLDRHQQQLQSNLSALQHTSNWPSASSSLPNPDSPPSLHAHKASFHPSRLISLEEDYLYLVSLASTLSVKCTEGTSVLMNSAVVAESKKTMRQTERMKKLTMLATFFIPVSFTTSIFGMNFRQFGQGGLSIWIWAAVLAPVLLVTAMSYIWSPGRIAKKAKRVFGKGSRGKGKGEKDEKDGGA